MHADPALAPQTEPAVPPGDDSNDDPTPPLPADDGAERHPSAPGSAQGEGRQHLKKQEQKEAQKEEPELNNEGDLPSDGRDPQGEAMIEQVNKPLDTGSKLERT